MIRSRLAVSIATVLMVLSLLSGSVRPSTALILHPEVLDLFQRSALGLRQHAQDVDESGYADERIEPEDICRAKPAVQPRGAVGQREASRPERHGADGHCSAAQDRKSVV